MRGNPHYHRRLERQPLLVQRQRRRRQLLTGGGLPTTANVAAAANDETINRTGTAVQLFMFVALEHFLDLILGLFYCSLHYMFVYNTFGLHKHK